MRVIETVSQAVSACAELPRPLGLVPTMGYLHPGHLSLVRRARRENASVVVSIFVNPAQFGPNEDLSTYPRNMPRDLTALEEEKVNIVFTPATSELYPPGMDTWVEVGAASRRLEGAHRPGHFRGVATVVAKLFNVTSPTRAYFGQKDGQQAAVVKAMVRDLNMPVEIVVSPTVRESDGLACSSRNSRLNPTERRAAPVVYRALRAAEQLWLSGEVRADELKRRARTILEAEPLVRKIDYVSVAHGETMEELEVATNGAMLSIAAWIGNVRLIDNVILSVGRSSCISPRSLVVFILHVETNLEDYH